MENRLHLDGFILQEVIPHDDEDVFYCTGYVDKAGILKSFFSAQKIRQYYPRYGITTYAVSRHNTKVRSLVEEVLAGLEYRGLFDIEFLYDARDKAYKLIEINPRTHLANSHALACGVNSPYAAYCDLSGLSPDRAGLEEREMMTEGVHWLYLESDLGSFWRKRRDGELNVLCWLRSLFSARAFALFDRRDLRPFLKSLSRLGGLLVRKLRG